MSLDKTKLKNLITSVLKKADVAAKGAGRSSSAPKLYSEDAVELLLLTAAQESDLGTYTRQLGGGPAL